MTAAVTCVGCGGRFPDIAGPVHRYMESSPSCWAAFGSVLAREYGDRAYFFEIHRLSVDAYSAQHPGRPSRQSIHSIGVHLIRLCLVLEHGLRAEHANAAMLEAGKLKHSFTWLEPPVSLGATTVADVEKTTTAETHKEAVRAWARSTWNAWSTQHAIIRAWLPAGRWTENQPREHSQ